MLNHLWNKFVNRETISYLIFGVLTTAVDWAVYPISRHFGASVAAATVCGWAAAVLFAFVTNKIYVFQSRERSLAGLLKEFSSFVACRLFSGVVTVAAMVVMVDFLGWNEYFGKVLVSAMSLVLNYVFSKLFIFKKSSAGEL